MTISKTGPKVQTRAARESQLCVFGTPKNRCFKSATVEIKVGAGAWLPCCGVCLHSHNRTENA